MNEKLREALEDLATRIGIIWIELLNNVDVGEEIEKLHQVECDILALAATPGETPNELTRQTMTATETGQNVVTFENIESMFKELAHPAPADGALREILSKLWDAAVLYRLAWREQTTIGKQDRLEADIAIQHALKALLLRPQAPTPAPDKWDRLAEITGLPRAPRPQARKEKET